MVTEKPKNQTQGGAGLRFRDFRFPKPDMKRSTLKYLINEQGAYVVFLLLSKYSFIRDFRVERHGFSPKFFS